MVMDTLDTIFDACGRVINDRDIGDVFDALDEEVDELDDEIVLAEEGMDPGEDGIIGESVDVLLCAVDMIFQTDPTMTAEKLQPVIDRKLAKWERLYSKAAA